MDKDFIGKAILEEQLAKTDKVHSSRARTIRQSNARHGFEVFDGEKKIGGSRAE
jgi:aminomethyltransferase